MPEANTNPFSNRIVKLSHARWREFQFIQQDTFKNWSTEAKEKLKNSMLKNQFTQPFFVWSDSSDSVTYCLDGFHRVKILKELSEEGVEIPDTLPALYVQCESKQEAAELVLQYSSAYAKITEKGLADFLEIYKLDFEQMSTVIDLPGMNALDFMAKYNDPGNEKAIVAASLQERFIVPPFSVFDTRQGYWQDRKKLWNKLGFDSQATREDIELVAKSGQAPAIYELRNKMRAALGREPDWDEILAEADKRGLHIYSGASVFDPVLTEICYRWFCPAGGAILDPFAGGSVRGIVASVLSYYYLGIDLRQEQIEANGLQATALNQKLCVWMQGDSNKTLDSLRDPVDFIFSCPPYHDLEQYSDDPADLSNMDYHEFCTVYRSIITKAMSRLKPNRFACFVVSDIRAKDGSYRNFVSETIDCFTKCMDENGHPVKLYNEIILINVAGSLPIRIGKQFGGYRKVGKMHQNVLVFYKGDPKKIKEEFPEIKVEEYLQELNYQPNIAQSIVDD